MITAHGGSGLTGLAHNSDGQLFVASSRDSRVLLVEDGQLLDFSSTGGSPQGLVIDKSGTVLVADAAHGAVLELGEDGQTRVIFREFERMPLRVRVAAGSQLPLPRGAAAGRSPWGAPFPNPSSFHHTCFPFLLHHTCFPFLLPLPP